MFENLIPLYYDFLWFQCFLLFRYFSFVYLYLFTYTMLLLQEDDEHTIEEDEALITEEERQEELTALHNEVDLPLEELLRRYTMGEGELSVWLMLSLVYNTQIFFYNDFRPLLNHGPRSLTFVQVNGLVNCKEANWRDPPKLLVCFLNCSSAQISSAFLLILYKLN